MVKEQWQFHPPIVVPITGKVQFLNFWTDNQFIRAGEPIFSIVPKNEFCKGDMFMKNDPYNLILR
jgi:hypothetical protein